MVKMGLNAFGSPRGSSAADAQGVMLEGNLTLSEKTALELLDEAEAALRNKKQRQYFSIAGFLFLLAHAFTHLTLLLVISIGFFCAAIIRYAQFRAFARTHATRNENHIDESKSDDGEDQPSSQFTPNFVMPTIQLNYSGKEYDLSFQYEKKDWEGDDILLCTFANEEAHLHPMAFFEHLKSASLNYLHSRIESEIRSLEQKPCIKFGYLEDSRDYPSFEIEGQEITVQSKYLCPVFYIVDAKAGPVLIVDALRDETGEDIPSVITDLPAGVLEKPSAMYSEEEGGWVAK